MAYEKTIWNAGGAPGISAEKLNKIETGIASAHTIADAALARTGGTMTGALGTAATAGAIGVSVGNAKLEVKNNGTSADAAYMSFHRQGLFAAHFGIDTDNKWKVGGWSMGATAYELWHDNRMRVHSSGLYLEWYSTTLGGWYPVGGGSAIQATYTRQAGLSGSRANRTWYTLLDIQNKRGMLTHAQCIGSTISYDNDGNTYYATGTVSFRITLDDQAETWTVSVGGYIGSPGAAVNMTYLSDIQAYGGDYSTTQVVRQDAIYFMKNCKLEVYFDTTQAPYQNTDISSITALARYALHIGT